MEIGGQIAALNLSDFGATHTGFGGRFSSDLTRWMAAEGEFNYFPRDRVVVDSGVGGSVGLRMEYRRQRVEMLLGPKSGVRHERFGVFAKIRPGFTRLSDEGVLCASPACPLVTYLLARPAYRTEFALNLGGVFEFYPTRRTVARLDLGTTMIRHRSTFAPPCENCTSQNLASGFSFGYRF